MVVPMLRRALAVAALAMGTLRAEAPLSPVRVGTPGAVGLKPSIAVASVLPVSVTTSAISMTGLLGYPVPRLPANVASGALTMTGLLGGPSVKLPASVKTSPIQMTGVPQASGRRNP